MASCNERREACDRTLARFATTDWGEPPVVVIDRAAHERVLDRMNDTSRRVLERAVAEADDIFLYLEDDLEFNRSLRHDLDHWPPLVDRLAGDYFFGSLYNPNVVAVASQQDPRSFTVADPDKVYGAQAFVLSVATARWILDHWNDVPGLPDIRFSRLAARRSPIYYHRPSLVQHRPVDSTWGGTQHAANDFSPNWRPPEAPERRGAGVLVVEDRAHLTSGHYPGGFADLAEGFGGARSPGGRPHRPRLVTVPSRPVHRAPVRPHHPLAGRAWTTRPRRGDDPRGAPAPAEGRRRARGRRGQ